MLRSCVMLTSAPPCYVYEYVNKDLIGTMVEGPSNMVDR